MKTIPLFKVRMSNTTIDNLSTVLSSGYIGQGPKVDLFEDKLWDILDTLYKPVTVNSCTSAIELALNLCGVDYNSEVISTPQTCWASNSPIVNRGATIRWADIDPITGLIDPTSVEKLITNKTKAIMAVDWAGKICNFDKLKSFNIPVIEDAAHVWDVFTNIPNTNRGDYICYSFQAIKYLTTGDGGILICQNEEKEKLARLLRWYGLDRTKGESFRCTQNINISGMKWHMNDIAATIGLSNIEEAEQSVYKQRNNARYYINNIKNKDIIIPSWDHTCSYWLFSIHVLNNRKLEFMQYLNNNGIQSSPVHYRNDLYSCVSKFIENDLPGVNSFDLTQICIPVGWWLSTKELDYITNIINNF